MDGIVDGVMGGTIYILLAERALGMRMERDLDTGS